MRIEQPSVKLLWVTPSADKVIEEAGRTCYKSEQKITELSSEKFVRKLYKEGHHAMLEHASASVRVITDRGITHEIVRHRIASYAQESTRFVNYSKSEYEGSIGIIVPPSIIDNEQKQAIWHKAIIAAEKAYFDLLDIGCAPQIARSVLPTCTKSEIVMTMNLREWLHFFKLRTAKNAHPQIREIAYSVQQLLRNHFCLVRDL